MDGPSGIYSCLVTHLRVHRKSDNRQEKGIVVTARVTGGGEDGELMAFGDSDVLALVWKALLSHIKHALFQ